MLNSTEQGNTTTHKTNTLTKKTFLSFQLADVVFIQHLRVGKKEKFFLIQHLRVGKKEKFYSSVFIMLINVRMQLLLVFNVYKHDK